MTWDDARWIAPLIYLGVALGQAWLLHRLRQRLTACHEERVVQALAQTRFLEEDLGPTLARAYSDGYRDALASCVRTPGETPRFALRETRSPN